MIDVDAEEREMSESKLHFWDRSELGRPVFRSGPRDVYLTRVFALRVFFFHRLLVCSTNAKLHKAHLEGASGATSVFGLFDLDTEDNALCIMNSAMARRKIWRSNRKCGVASVGE